MNLQFSCAVLERICADHGLHVGNQYQYLINRSALIKEQAAIINQTVRQTDLTKKYRYGQLVVTVDECLRVYNNTVDTVLHSGYKNKPGYQIDNCIGSCISAFKH